MILGCLALAIATAASILGAAALCRPLRTGEAWTDGVLFLVVRLCLVSIVVLAAGALHGLRMEPLVIVAILALGALLALGEHRRLLPLRRPAPGPVLGALLVLIGLRLLLQVWFFSPHQGDATAYHLPKIAEWIQAGRFTREMGLHPHVSFPAGFELVETWWVVFLHHDVLIEMAGVEFLVLGFASTGALAKYVGLSDRMACLAGTIFILSPAFHFGATACLNDTAASASILSVAALIVGRTSDWCWIAAAGLGLGIKPTCGLAMPGMVLLRCLIPRERPSLSASWTGPAAAGMGLLLGVWWYARNVLWFGNPVYPAGTSALDNPVAVQMGPDLLSFWHGLRSFVNERISDRGVVLGANVDEAAGWGAPAYSLGLIALPWAMRLESRFRILAASFGVSVVLSLLFIRSDAWFMKYLSYAAAIPSLAVAWAWTEAPQVRWVAAAGLGVSFAATAVPYDLPWRDLRSLASQSWVERSVLNLSPHPEGDDAMGCMGDFKTPSYLLYRPDFSCRVVYLRAENSSQLMETMRSNQLKTLYATRNSVQVSMVLQSALAQDLLMEMGGSFYRLR